MSPDADGPAPTRWGPWATAGLGIVIAVFLVVLQTATIVLSPNGASRVMTGSLLVPLGLHALTNLGATVEAALLS